MEQDGIRLARRSSGGGAVFHDLGNTCFTFMAGKPGYDKSVSTDIILQALRQLGVAASASGRNDLVMETADGPRKISGSAYRETQDRGFHHGTLLLNADLERLANYLNPDPKKLQAKGITSVRSRVANLAEFCRASAMSRYATPSCRLSSPTMAKRPSRRSFRRTCSPICPILPRSSPNKAAGNGISARRRRSATCLTSALSGAA